MRTLKKALSLVLVLALCLSLCAVGANAMNFADQDKIGEPYYVAVGVMTGMGILEGESENDDGSVNFAPQGSLTRAAAAKIASYILLGQEDADKLAAAVAPFADVPTSHWAAGYIAYAKDAGIISGAEENADGTVNFLPNDTLTGPQFTKVLLGAIGYGKNGEYDGSDWANKAITMGLTLGMYTSDLAMRTAAPLSREQAMLMVYNAMTKTEMVTYDAGKYTKGVNTLAETYYDYTVKDGANYVGAQQVDKVEYDAENDVFVASVSTSYDFTTDTRLAIGHIFDLYVDTNDNVLFADCLTSMVEYDKDAKEGTYTKDANKFLAAVNYTKDSSATDSISNIATYCNTILEDVGYSELLGVVTYTVDKTTTVVAVQSLEYNFVQVDVTVDDDGYITAQGVSYEKFYETAKDTETVSANYTGADFSKYTKSVTEFYKALKVADTTENYYFLEKVEPVVGKVERKSADGITIGGKLYVADLSTNYDYVTEADFAADASPINFTDTYKLIVGLDNKYLNIVVDEKAPDTPDYSDYSLVYVVANDEIQTFTGKFDPTTGAPITALDYTADAAFANGTYGNYGIKSIDGDTVLSADEITALGDKDDNTMDGTDLDDTDNKWYLGKLDGGELVLVSDIAVKNPKLSNAAETTDETDDMAKGITFDGKYVDGNSIFMYLQGTGEKFEVKYIKGAHDATDSTESPVPYSCVMNVVESGVATINAAFAPIDYVLDEEPTELPDYYYVTAYNGTVATGEEYEVYNLATAAKSTIVVKEITGKVGDAAVEEVITLTASTNTTTGATEYTGTAVDGIVEEYTLGTPAYFTLNGVNYIKDDAPADYALSSTVKFVNLVTGSTITDLSKVEVGSTVITYDPDEVAPETAKAEIITVFLTAGPVI